jgi:hypothetical protein
MIANFCQGVSPNQSGFPSLFVLFLLSQEPNLSFGSRDNRNYPKKGIMS